MQAIPRIKILVPSRPPLLRTRFPIKIATGPNISGIMSRLIRALIYPNLAYVLVTSLSGGYGGTDGDGIDRGNGGPMGCCGRRILPQLLQKLASSGANAPHFGQ